MKNGVFEIEDLELNDLDLGDLDLEGFDTDVTKSCIVNRYVLPRLHTSIKGAAVKYDNAVKFINEMSGAILDGNAIHCLASGNFIFGDFFEAFAVQNDLLIDDLTLSTLSISQDNVDSLHNMLVGDYLKSLNLIVSDYFWSHNRQNASYIYDQLDIGDMFQFAVSGTHTKIALLRFEEKKIVIKGSANLRSSRSIEEFSIETNDDLYDFHKAWHDEILNQYGTIKKTIRGSALFDKITKGRKKEKSWDQK